MSPPEWKASCSCARPAPGASPPGRRRWSCSHTPRPCGGAVAMVCGAGDRGRKPERRVCGAYSPPDPRAPRSPPDPPTAACLHVGVVLGQPGLQRAQQLLVLRAGGATEAPEIACVDGWVQVVGTCTLPHCLPIYQSRASATRSPCQPPHTTARARTPVRKSCIFCKYFSAQAGCSPPCSARCTPMAECTYRPKMAAGSRRRGGWWAEAQRGG